MELPTPVDHRRIVVARAANKILTIWGDYYKYLYIQDLSDRAVKNLAP
jgi:hypothetical protein